MIPPRPTKITTELCFHKEHDGGSCEIEPRWSVSSAKTAFRICDKHLAWGIRLSGVPAMVEAFKKFEVGEELVVVEEKEEVTEPAYPRSTLDFKRLQRQTKRMPTIPPTDTTNREEEGGRTIISERPFKKTNDRS